eukprot:1107828-Pelagomonas_calceolata.AAC.8
MVSQQALLLPPAMISCLDTGMGQSVCVAQELGLAERELALRLNKGIKAPKALYLASLVGGPQPSPELIQVQG